MDSVPHERRAHPRYSVKSGTYLYNESIFAEILNISTGGVLCKFLTDSQDKMTPVNSIDLISIPDKTCIQNIPTSDLNYYDPKSFKLLAMASVRESRLKFRTSDASMLKKIQIFIDSIAVPSPNQTPIS